MLKMKAFPLLFCTLGYLDDKIFPRRESHPCAYPLPPRGLTSRRWVTGTWPRHLHSRQLPAARYSVLVPSSPATRPPTAHPTLLSVDGSPPEPFPLKSYGT